MMNLTAFTLGCIGSLHCLGMCGPIAFALPVRTTNVWMKLLKYLTYNAGRVITYAFLGMLIGTVGKGFALAGLQQLLSILAGASLIAGVLLIHPPWKHTALTRTSHYLHGRLKETFRHHLLAPAMFSFLMLGFLNGLLPCGMVYTAAIGAMATGNASSGALFMVFFGLGTVPMMLAVSFAGNAFGTKMRSVFIKRVSPVLACCIGLLLIFRGLNLDIPYLSPAVSDKAAHSCH